MGLLPPEPPDDYGPGDDCTECFESGQTPNYIFVQFHGVVACSTNPVPPNGVVILCEQNPLKPCEFLGQFTWRGNSWECLYQMNVLGPGGDQSFLELVVMGLGLTAYFAADGSPCDIEFPTSYTACPAWGGAGGHGHVRSFSGAVIIGLTHHYHFVTVPGVRYEVDEVGIDHYQMRLATHFDHTNVLMLIEKEEFVIMEPDHPGHF